MNRAPLITWSPTFELGIPMLDEHHRGIVSLINALDFAIQREENADFFVQIIFNMTDCYAKLHFSAEEALMQAAGYPEVKTHKIQHADMVKQSFSAATQSMRLRDPHIYLRFLHDWWLDHIKNCDLPYGPFVRDMSADEIHGVDSAFRRFLEEQDQWAVACIKA